MIIMAVDVCMILILSVVYVNGNTDHGLPVSPDKSYDLLFQHAMKEYKNKNYESTTKLITEAIQDYKFDQEISAQCWIKCQAEFSRTKLKYTSILDGQLNNLHYSVKLKECSKSCKRKFLGERKDARDKTKELFKQKEPYKFLHYCYAELGNLNKALEAAYTYLEAHPDNKRIAGIVKELKVKTGSPKKVLQSLEESSHITLYRLGEEAYFSRNYSRSIEYMEESHTLFYKEMDKCLGRCEEQVDINNMLNSDSLFEHYRNLIVCRQACRRELTTGNTDTKPDKFVSLYYDFLQYAYWQVGKPRPAANLALSYLFLVPDDEKMLNNLRFYKKKANIMGKSLKPRPEAVKFYRQLSLESNLIVIAKGLSKHDDGLNLDRALMDLANGDMQKEHKSVLDEISSDKRVTKGDTEPRVSTDEKILTTDHLGTPRAYRNQARWKAIPGISQTDLLMEERELNGSNRVAFDNLLDEEACKKLMTLVKGIAIGSDGYQHSRKDASHPFTEKEAFTGITVGKAVDAYGDGNATYEDVALYFNASEKVRLVVQEYFNLERLNIAYTHLVCREALPERIDADEEHISHPIHSDNCNVNADGLGTCPKRRPAYTWRDYSAVLYLNDDFTGGDFVFSDYKSEIQARVKPKCGRMVAFQSKGIENLHGVLGVKSGTRYALPLWFTLSDITEDDRASQEKKLTSLKLSRNKNEL